jgi:hypothetical protein
MPHVLRSGLRYCIAAACCFALATAALASQPVVPPALYVPARPDVLFILDGHQLRGRVPVAFRDGALFLDGLRWLPSAAVPGTMRMPDGKVYPTGSLTPSDSLFYPSVPFVARQLRSGNSLHSARTLYYRKVDRMLRRMWEAYLANKAHGEAIAQRAMRRVVDPLLADTSTAPERAPHVDDDAASVFLWKMGRYRELERHPGPATGSARHGFGADEAAVEVMRLQRQLSKGTPCALIYSHGVHIRFIGAELVSEVSAEIQAARTQGRAASRRRSPLRDRGRVPEDILRDIAANAKADRGD